MICENCGKEHDGTFGSGRFCSRSCANKRNHSKEEKEKITRSLLEFYKKHPKDSFHKSEKWLKKQNICKFCGQPLSSGDHDICRLHPSKNWYKKLIPFGFDFSKIGTKDFFNEYEKSISLLIWEYEENKLSPKAIYEKYKLSRYFKSFETLLPILKQLGIKTRNIQEALKTAVEEYRVKLPHGSNLYHHGWHTTWMGTEIYYRSSYELDFAKELDKNHIQYDTECLRIKYWDSSLKEYRCAIPDFFLPETNEIIEIKSCYTYIEQEMIDKFKEYKKLGYTPKLILDHKEISIIS